jgi:hypothetical protein
VVEVTDLLNWSLNWFFILSRYSRLFTRSYIFTYPGYETNGGPWMSVANKITANCHLIVEYLQIISSKSLFRVHQLYQLSYLSISVKNTDTYKFQSRIRTRTNFRSTINPIQFQY